MHSFILNAAFSTTRISVTIMNYFYANNNYVLPEVLEKAGEQMIMRSRSRNMEISANTTTPFNVEI